MPGHLPMFDTDYSNPYGLWEVTTEGDCEGKSTIHLGTFIGYLDEIATALSGAAFYTLTFKKISGEKAPVSYPSVKDVHVNLSGGPAISDDSKRLALFRQMLEKRPVKVEPSNYWHSVRIDIPDERLNELRRQAALAKLTKEERELLGLAE